MRKVLICLAALALGGSRCLAAAWIETTPHGHFVRAGNAFVCQGTGRAEGRKLPTEACLYIGPLSVGATEASLKDDLGPEDDVRKDRSGATNYVYLRVAATEPKFITVTVVGGKVVAGQISGPEPIDGFSFEDINLGTDAGVVKAKFGAPVKVMPSDTPGAEKWSYAPANFSFEVTDGTVSAIRVATDAYR